MSASNAYRRLLAGKITPERYIAIVKRSVQIAHKVRHGDMPAPNAEQLLEPDPDVYLAGGPLAPDDCECDGLCRCDGENPRYGPGSPDWEHDRQREERDA